MYGYNGDLYVGLYHCTDVSLNIITHRLTAINILTLNALASFAILLTSRKYITKAMIMQVKSIVLIGVRYFL